MRVASVIGQKVHGSAQPPAKKMAGQIEKETMKFHKRSQPIKTAQLIKI